MDVKISQINKYNYFNFRADGRKNNAQNNVPQNYISVYGDSEIRTNPAQLSLFHMHDFHGQNIRMERAYNAVTQFDKGDLTNQDKVFDKNMPIDRLKLCSGDMFLGENPKEIDVVNEFLNISGVIANTIGNHECDSNIKDFARKVQSRRYRLVGANMHPNKLNQMNTLISNSFIVRVNGNDYGIIGLSPIDMKTHVKGNDYVEQLNISDLESTVKDLQNDIDLIKSKGVNKIILLSHLGLENEQYIAKNVNDIDIILGGHTHNLLREVKEGENLFYSPKGEPVLIMQVGRDGEHIGIPNLKFNEFGQITAIQYNVMDTDKFARSLVAKTDFENILGTPEVVGKIDFVEKAPDDIYANENPHCNFIADCLREELGTDIAVINSANLRENFHVGDVDTRDLHLITPFGNKMVVMEATEKEIVDSIKSCASLSMADPKHRPGILQVSGLRYTLSKSSGEIKSMSFVDKNGNLNEIDVNNPRTDKFYTIACDDFCATKENNGMGLTHRYNNALAIYNTDKDAFVADYLRKQTQPSKIISDGRIQIVE